MVKGRPIKKLYCTVHESWLTWEPWNHIFVVEKYRIRDTQKPSKPFISLFLLTLTLDTFSTE